MDNIELKQSLILNGKETLNSAGDSPIYSLFDEVWKVRKSLHFELVKTSFEKHDNNHFETTLTYQKLGSKKEQIKEYDIDFFFFVPNSIIPDSYSSEKFLARLTNHMRLRSPEIEPSVFLGISDERSPFGRLSKVKDRLLENPELQLGDQITKEFRVAANYIISTIARINVNKLVSSDYDLSFHYHIELEITRELLKTFRLIISRV